MQITTLSGCQLHANYVQAWDEMLRAETVLNNPFLHPRWIELVAGVTQRVEVAVLHDEGKVRGFFPFERTGRHTGRPVAAAMSDWHGLVAVRQQEISLTDLFRRCGLSHWSFDHVPVEQHWFAPFTHRTEPAAVVDLSGGADAWWQQRSQAHPSWTKQMERKRRKLHRELGPLRFEWHTAEPAALAALVEWKQWRLRRSGFRNVFQMKWLCDLLPLVCREQSVEFAGVLTAMYAGSQLLAVHMGLRRDELLVSWIPAFHPEYASYSPGAILQVEVARTAGSEGIARIDLGRGMNPLKQILANQSVELAIGAVDLRFVRRWMQRGASRARELVDASPMGAQVLRACRPVRNWLFSHQ